MLSENEAKCSLPERLIINLDHIQAGKWGGGFYWRGASIRENTVVNLAKVKVDLHAKDEGRRSNGSTVRAHTNGTDRRTLPSALFPPLRAR